MILTRVWAVVYTHDRACFEKVIALALTCAIVQGKFRWDPAASLPAALFTPCALQRSKSLFSRTSNAVALAQLGLGCGLDVFMLVCMCCATRYDILF